MALLAFYIYKWRDLGWLDLLYPDDNKALPRQFYDVAVYSPRLLRQKQMPSRAPVAR